MTGERLRRLVLFVSAVSTALAAVYPIGAQQAPAANCRITGRVTAATSPLPGVALVAYAGETVAAATSTELDGSYQLALPLGTFRLKAVLTGFTPIEQSVSLAGLPAGALAKAGEPCAQSVNVELALAPRTPRAAPPSTAGPGARPQTVTVQSQDASAVAETIAPEREAADAATRLLLPPGFSTEAPTESLAVTGNMTNIDRGMIGERMDAIMRGEFDPASGQFGEGFGPGRGGFGPGRQGGPGGRGEGQGRGGPGGPGAREFVLGGRGGRRKTYNVQANYGCNGPALDREPYLLRLDSPRDS